MLWGSFSKIHFSSTFTSIPCFFFFAVEKSLSLATFNSFFLFSFYPTYWVSFYWLFSLKFLFTIVRTCLSVTTKLRRHIFASVTSSYTKTRLATTRMTGTMLEGLKGVFFFFLKPVKISRPLQHLLQTILVFFEWRAKSSFTDLKKKTQHEVFKP